MFDLKLQYKAETLQDIINCAYVSQKLCKPDVYIPITQDDEIYSLLNDMNNHLVSLYNTDMINGYMQFLIQQETVDGDIKLYPADMKYLIEDDTKFLFF